MSLEDDLSKLERQVNNFSIAGAAGNFHTGFSIGDDARGSGAGAQHARIGPTPEDRIAFLEQSFKNFTIRGGHEVSVTGSLVAGGFAISAKQAPSGEETGGTGPTPMGACCIGASCSVLTAADCATMGGIYFGDGTPCDPNPCTGACCADDFSCSITSEADCVGTFQGVGTVCDPNPCLPTGACCIGGGGSGGTCIEESQSVCEGAGGTYLGDGSTCIDNPCQCTCPPADAPTLCSISGTFYYDDTCGPDGVPFSFSGALTWSGSSLINGDCHGVLEEPLTFPCHDPSGAPLNCDATCSGVVTVNLVLSGPSTCHWAVVLGFRWTDDSGIDHTCNVSTFGVSGTAGLFTLTGPYTTSGTCNGGSFSTFDTLMFS